MTPGKANFIASVFRGLGSNNKRKEDDWSQALENARKKHSNNGKSKNSKTAASQQQSATMLLPSKFTATYTGRLTTAATSSKNQPQKEEEISGSLVFEATGTMSSYTITGQALDKSGPFLIREGTFLAHQNSFYWVAEPETATRAAFQPSVLVTGTTTTINGMLCFEGQWKASEGNRQGVLTFQVPLHDSGANN